jgi:DNA invertase Pin-like site-specific DNA recombinase
MLLGYARVSTRIAQDTEHQERDLRAMGCDRIFLDRGYTGSNTDRPGLAQAMACLRPGDTLAVTKLDRLARSLLDARRLAEEIVAAGASLRLGHAVYDPTDPVGRLMFNVLAIIAEFERDLIVMRTRDGLETARLKGRLRGRPPKLDRDRERALVAMVAEDRYTLGQVAGIFGVSRSTVGRALARAGQSGAGDEPAAELA